MNTDIVINTAAALAISILTARITVQLSLRKFYAERWWDRKIKAYTDIFEALYKLKHYADLKYDDSIGHRTLSDEESQKLDEQWRCATYDVDKAIEIGSFTISLKSIDSLTEFRKRPRASLDYSPVFELAAEESKLLTEYIDILKRLAAKDLKLK